MIKRYAIEGELIYQKDDGHLVRYEDYEMLQQKFGGVSSLCEEAMRINCEWEKSMMAAIGEDGIGSVTKAIEQLKADKHALQQKLDAMAAENAALKISRVILAENTLETCNAIASAGFRHEAIMRGLMASKGNGNKYPKPITTLVDEALRQVETPATDAYLNSVRAEGAQMCVDALVTSDDDDFTNAPHICAMVEHRLRSGTHDITDKAG